MSLQSSPSLASLCLVTCALAAPFAARGEDTPAPAEPVLPAVRVEAERDQAARRSAAEPDSSRLLIDQPGYASAFGGGVASLPVYNGFADQRLGIRVDGMDLSAACGNHMNAPMSYLSPGLLGAIRLSGGVAPVSLGGDSLGAAIELRSPDPVYAASGEGQHAEGWMSAGSRSVDHAQLLGLGATLASENMSLAYAGSEDRGRSYKDGNGEKVPGSMYERRNNQLTFALKGDRQQFVLRASEQRIPYQGFPNQYMDMTGNQARSLNASYTRELAAFTLDTRLYWQDTRHKMGFFTPERSGTMPMETHGEDMGYSLKATIPVGAADVLALGNEFHRQTLDDWWPPVAGSMMMGPQTYVNLDGGRRDRHALFAEWDRQINERWHTQLGVRDELVSMDTGAVQGYGSMMMAADTAAAAAFNAREHARTDNNLDFTALARFTPEATADYEFGLARKTRSPSLYERYTWGRSTMAATMTNWFGDANGYVGNLDLKPEVAHTLSLSGSWHDASRQAWRFTLNPYYSYVRNYIDVDVIGSFNPYGISTASGSLLQFANHDAVLYGFNASWLLALLPQGEWGKVDLRGTAALTRGSRTDGGELYRMMPLNGTLALDHQAGKWLSTLEARMVSGKKRLDAARHEIGTAAYTLVDVRSTWQWTPRVQLSGGVRNLFDKAWADPMGGVNLSGLHEQNSGTLAALPGYGRSIDIGIRLSF